MIILKVKDRIIIVVTKLVKSKNTILIYNKEGYIGEIFLETSKLKYIKRHGKEEKVYEIIPK